MRSDFKHRVLTIVAALVLIASGIYLVPRLVNEIRGSHNNKQIQDMYYQDDGSADRVYATDIYHREFDFSPLLEINEDTIGWLNAGDGIDLPVMQSDNEYYLRNNFYKKTDSNGAAFLNMYNQITPQKDKSLLIHGHLTPATFASLDKFRDFEYVRDYPIVTFRTIYDDDDVFYTPVFVYDETAIKDDPTFLDPMQFTSADSRFGEADFNKAEYKEAFRQYLSEMSSRSYWTARVDVDTDDSLLILISCSYLQYDDSRIFVVCRKLRDDETVESIVDLYKQVQNSSAGSSEETE